MPKRSCIKESEPVTKEKSKLIPATGLLEKLNDECVLLIVKQCSFEICFLLALGNHYYKDLIENNNIMRSLPRRVSSLEKKCIRHSHRLFGDFISITVFKKNPILSTEQEHWLVSHPVDLSQYVKELVAFGFSREAISQLLRLSTTFNKTSLIKKKIQTVVSPVNAQQRPSTDNQVIDGATAEVRVDGQEEQENRIGTTNPVDWMGVESVNDTAISQQPSLVEAMISGFTSLIAANPPFSLSCVFEVIKKEYVALSKSGATANREAGKIPESTEASMAPIGGDDSIKPYLARIANLKDLQSVIANYLSEVIGEENPESQAIRAAMQTELLLAIRKIRFFLAVYSKNHKKKDVIDSLLYSPFFSLKDLLNIMGLSEQQSRAHKVTVQQGVLSREDPTVIEYYHLCMSTIVLFYNEFLKITQDEKLIAEIDYWFSCNPLCKNDLGEITKESRQENLSRDLIIQLVRDWDKINKAWRVQSSQREDKNHRKNSIGIFQPWIYNTYDFLFLLVETVLDIYYQQDPDKDNSSRSLHYRHDKRVSSSSVFVFVIENLPSIHDRLLSRGIPRSECLQIGNNIWGNERLVEYAANKTLTQYFQRDNEMPEEPIFDRWLSSFFKCFIYLAEVTSGNNTFCELGYTQLVSLIKKNERPYYVYYFRSVNLEGYFLCMYAKLQHVVDDRGIEGIAVDFLPLLRAGMINYLNLNVGSLEDCLFMFYKNRTAFEKVVKIFDFFSPCPSKSLKVYWIMVYGILFLNIKKDYSPTGDYKNIYSYLLDLMNKNLQKNHEEGTSNNSKVRELTNRTLKLLFEKIAARTFSAAIPGEDSPEAASELGSPEKSLRNSDYKTLATSGLAASTGVAAFSDEELFEVIPTLVKIVIWLYQHQGLKQYQDWFEEGMLRHYLNEVCKHMMSFLSSNSSCDDDLTRNFFDCLNSLIACEMKRALVLPPGLCNEQNSLEQSVVCGPTFYSGSNTNLEDLEFGTASEASVESEIPEAIVDSEGSVDSESSVDSEGSVDSADSIASEQLVHLIEGCHSSYGYEYCGGEDEFEQGEYTSSWLGLIKFLDTDSSSPRLDPAPAPFKIGWQRVTINPMRYSDVAADSVSEEKASVFLYSALSMLRKFYSKYSKNQSMLEKGIYFLVQQLLIDFGIGFVFGSERKSNAENYSRIKEFFYEVIVKALGDELFLPQVLNQWIGVLSLSIKKCHMEDFIRLEEEAIKFIVEMLTINNNQENHLAKEALKESWKKVLLDHLRRGDKLTKTCGLRILCVPEIVEIIAPLITRNEVVILLKAGEQIISLKNIHPSRGQQQPDSVPDWFESYKENLKYNILLGLYKFIKTIDAKPLAKLETALFTSNHIEKLEAADGMEDCPTNSESILEAAFFVCKTFTSSKRGIEFSALNSQAIKVLIDASTEVKVYTTETKKYLQYSAVSDCNVRFRSLEHLIDCLQVPQAQEIQQKIVELLLQFYLLNIHKGLYRYCEPREAWAFYMLKFNLRIEQELTAELISRFIYVSNKSRGLISKWQKQFINYLLMVFNLQDRMWGEKSNARNAENLLSYVSLDYAVRHIKRIELTSIRVFGCLREIVANNLLTPLEKKGVAFVLLNKFAKANPCEKLLSAAIGKQLTELGFLCSTGESVIDEKYLNLSEVLVGLTVTSEANATASAPASSAAHHGIFRISTQEREGRQSSAIGSSSLLMTHKNFQQMLGTTVAQLYASSESDYAGWEQLLAQLSQESLDSLIFFKDKLKEMIKNRTLTMASSDATTEIETTLTQLQGVLAQLTQVVYEQEFSPETSDVVMQEVTATSTSMETSLQEETTERTKTTAVIQERTEAYQQILLDLLGEQIGMEFELKRNPSKRELGNQSLLGRRRGCN